jgi:hypothetical protein
MKKNKIFTELIAIVYFTIIFSLVGIILTEFNDRFVINKFIEEDSELNPINKSLMRQIVETVIIIITLTIITHYSSKLLIKMPFFLDSKKVEHENIKIITSASILRVCVFLFSTGLRNKIKILNDLLD